MKRIALVLILIAALAGGIVYNIHSRSAPQSPTEGENTVPESSQAVPVTVGTVRNRSMQRTITLVGVLRAESQATLSVRIPARILSISARTGDQVRRGQSLVRLDSRDAVAQEDSATAAVQAAQAQYRKALEGRRARIVEMDGKLADARAGFSLARSKLRQAEIGEKLATTGSAADIDRSGAAVRQAEAGLRRAGSDLSQANETVKRLRFLYSRGGIPKVDLDTAESFAESAKAGRDSAAAALDEARAAERPASASAPLRKQSSDADILAARAGVNQAQDGLRLARMAKQRALALSDRDIESARAQVVQAEAGVRQAYVQASAGTLASPLDGVVGEVQAHAGETAQPGQPLLMVFQPRSIYLEAACPARYARSITRGRPATVHVDSLPDHPLSADVIGILPTAAADSRTLSVKLRLRSTRKEMAPGISARADLELARNENAVSIPVDALRNEGSSSFVYVVAGGKAVRRNLVMGPSEGANVQVLAGVESGESVIVSGPASLQSGMAVRVVGR